MSLARTASRSVTAASTCARHSASSVTARAFAAGPSPEYSEFTVKKNNWIEKHETYRENKFEQWKFNPSRTAIVLFTFVLFPAWFLKTFKEEQTLRDTVMRNREAHKYIFPRSSE